MTDEAQMICPECDYMPATYFHVCPYCGADMVEAHPEQEGEPC